MRVERHLLADARAGSAAEPPPSPASRRRALAPGERPSLARAVSVLAWLYVAFLLAQFLLAGLGVFVHPRYVAWHRTLVHAVGWLDFLILLMATIGRLPRTIVRPAAGVVALIGVQYLTIHLRGVLQSVTLGALHPVSAAVLFAVSWTLARRAHAFAWSGPPSGDAMAFGTRRTELAGGARADRPRLSSIFGSRPAAAE